MSRGLGCRLRRCVGNRLACHTCWHGCGGVVSFGWLWGCCVVVLFWWFECPDGLSHVLNLADEVLEPAVVEVGVLGVGQVHPECLCNVVEFGDSCGVNCFCHHVICCSDERRHCGLRFEWELLDLGV